MNKSDIVPLSTLNGVLLGFTSIIGSGLFFLPVLVANLSPDTPILPWLILGIGCVPFIYVFSKISIDLSSGEGVIGIVRKTLGIEWARYATAILITGTSFGIPLAAVVAGTYVSTLFPNSSEITNVAAAIILCAAWLQNIFGFQLALLIQRLLVCITTIALLFFAFDVGGLTPEIKLPSWNNLVSSAALAPMIFWAFAGWENLSFLSNRFANPEKQVPFVMMTTLIMSCLVYIAFTLIAVFYMPASESLQSSPLTFGDMVSAGLLSVSSNTLILLVVIACLLIWANSAAWILGLSSLFGAMTLENSVTSSQFRRLLVLGGGYICGYAVIVFFPNTIPFIVSAVSAAFLTIYALVLISFGKIAKSPQDRIVGIASGIVLLGGIIFMGHALIPQFILSVLFLSPWLYKRFSRY